MPAWQTGINNHSTPEELTVVKRCTVCGIERTLQHFYRRGGGMYKGGRKIAWENQCIWCRWGVPPGTTPIKPKPAPIPFIPDTLIIPDLPKKKVNPPIGGYHRLPVVINGGTCYRCKHEIPDIQFHPSARYQVSCPNCGSPQIIGVVT